MIHQEIVTNFEYLLIAETLNYNLDSFAEFYTTLQRTPYGNWDSEVFRALLM